MGFYCAYYDDPCRTTSDRRPCCALPRGQCERFAPGKQRFLPTTRCGGCWCNVGRASFVNLRAYAEAVEPGDSQTGSVMCFVVHPEHRHRGVATALLASTDDYLRDLGMATAEGYPRAAPPTDPDFPWSAASYKGTRDMYEQAGYTSIASSIASGDAQGPVTCCSRNASGPASPTGRSLPFRRWKRPQGWPASAIDTRRPCRRAVDRRRYASEISDDDASRSGYASARDLVADLAAHRPADLPDPVPSCRRSDPRTNWHATISCRSDLQAFDSGSSAWIASAHRAWTMAALRAIAQHPGVRAADLAKSLESRPGAVQARRPQTQEPRSHDQPRGRLPAVARGEAYTGVLGRRRFPIAERLRVLPANQERPHRRAGLVNARPSTMLTRSGRVRCTSSRHGTPP